MERTLLPAGEAALELEGEQPVGELGIAVGLERVVRPVLAA
jgi:hypothetical protein